MSDATRAEALAWCIERSCDFVHPVFPPPNGWMWANSNPGLILTPIFTNTTDHDITALDVGAHHPAEA